VKTRNMSWMGLIAVLLFLVAQLPVQASVDVIVSGVVTESGTGAAVSGATVKLTTCHQTFTTLSDSSGQYTLVIPNAALSGCTSVELFGSKYRASYFTTISVASLKANPQRDLALYDHHGE
jgi:hypothetical protein